jgi:hypothetical protein
MNVGIDNQEMQDRLGYKAASIEGFTDAATNSLYYYRGDKRFRDYQMLLHPDYLLGKNDMGQTQAFTREAYNNTMNKNNIFFPIFMF